MYKTKAIIVIINLIIMASVYAQENTDNPDSILSYLKVQYYNQKIKVLHPYIFEFENLWNAGYFTEQQKNNIRHHIQLIKKWGSPYSNQLDYIKTLNLFGQKKLPDSSLDVFLKVGSQLAGLKVSRSFKSYLNKTYRLLSYGELNKMASMSWYYRGGVFKFTYDDKLKIDFRGGDLVCKSRKDSSEIIQTRGVFIPFENKWIGRDGKLTWKRVQMDKYRELNLKSYLIDLNSSQYEADSVVFTDHKYFNIPFFGKLSERVYTSKPNSRTSYPRFQSYAKNYNINGLFGRIDLRSGLNIQGRRIILEAEKDKWVQISFQRDSNRFIKIRSKEFLINDDEIISPRANSCIYLDNDSIVHPSVQFKYTKKYNQLSLNRRADGIELAPFYNSYHKINMYCDVIKWSLDSMRLELGSRRNAAKLSEALYESLNFFSEYEYYRLQGIDLINPLILLKKYSDLYNTKIVHLSLLANYMKKPEVQASNLLFNLAEKGFVSYDVKNRKAVIQDHLFDFLKAKAGLMDHDVIQYKSKVSGKSSTSLDLKNYNLFIRGVNEIFLSDSQKVQIVPYKKEITMKKNRDFLFNGHVKGGLFDFGAVSCEFQYDEFRLNLPNIDSLSFHVRNPNPNKENPNKLIKVKGVLANLSGDIRIDNPENKSGRVIYPEYPIFRNINEAYVYFEDSLIMNNTLKKERFYYCVQPFTIDSLDNFSTEGLGFKGYMVTDSIFPILHKDLQVMPDYSLGINYSSEEKGILMYKRSGLFKADISLSNQGFFADGELESMNSHTTANKFLIYPDSLIAQANSFALKPMESDTIYPDVIGKHIDFKWLPHQDLMQVRSIDTPFRVYEEKASLIGKIELTPMALNGSGLFQLENFRLKSNHYKFSEQSIYSDSTEFSLYSLADQLTFSSKDYRVNIHLKNRKGLFKSNGGEAITSFPLNGYVTKMDEIIWDMDSAILFMKNNLVPQEPEINTLSDEDLLGVDLSGSYFLSLRPDQDSLSFYTMTAKYAMDSNILYAEDVKYINVANAAVFPSNGKITIRENAVIPTIKKARIISDIHLQYHKVYDANVNIFSKNNFLANGKYDYIDANDHPQLIQLSTITVDSLKRTYALGNIPEEDVFFLNPYFFFTGDIKWTSDNPFVRFYGGFRINQNCFYNDSIWVKFDTIINPKDVKIPLNDRLLDMKDRRLDLGLFYSPNDGLLYSRFLNSKANIVDRDVFKVRGIIQYNEPEGQFEVGKLDRLNHKTWYGNKISLNPEECFLKGQGRFDIIDPIDELSMTAYGEFQHSIGEDTTAFHLMLNLDFLFDKHTLDVMCDSILQQKLEKVNLNTDFIKMVMVNSAKKESEDDILYDLEWYGEIREHKEEFKETLILSDIHFCWDKVKRVYQSRGKIGLAMINNKQIHKYVDGLVVIDRKKSKNSIQIYLEAHEGLWYYFSMKNRLMQAVSSDKVFNAKLTEVDQKKRMIKKDDIIQYEFVISDLKNKIDFLRKYKR